MQHSALFCSPCHLEGVHCSGHKTSKVTEGDGEHDKEQNRSQALIFMMFLKNQELNNCHLHVSHENNRFHTIDVSQKLSEKGGGVKLCNLNT